METTNSTIGNPNWKPGVSGNPKGSLVGSRHKTARLLDELAEGAAVQMFNVIFETAIAGDMQAARIIADRIWPIRKGRPIPFDLPEISTANGVMEVLRTILAKMSIGEISPEEAQAASMTAMLYSKAQETAPIPLMPGSTGLVIKRERFREQITLIEQGIHPNKE